MGKNPWVPPHKLNASQAERANWSNYLSHATTCSPDTATSQSSMPTAWMKYHSSYTWCTWHRAAARKEKPFWDCTRENAQAPKLSTPRRRTVSVNGFLQINRKGHRKQLWETCNHNVSIRPTLKIYSHILILHNNFSPIFKIYFGTIIFAITKNSNAEHLSY